MLEAIFIMIDSKGHCEVSQQFRARIDSGSIRVSSHVSLDRIEGGENEGWFRDETLEDRIQPSSFEPAIRDHCYVLDPGGGLFRPNASHSVMRMLLQVPKGRRRKVRIDGGFEVKKSFSYLIPLEDGLTLRLGDRVISSPRSGRGRLFLNTRLLADYSSSFDEIVCSEEGLDRNLWLLLQPTQFNVIIHPGMTFNQLRFFSGGPDSRLSDGELEAISDEVPLFVGGIGDHIIQNGLNLHLELKGNITGGIVGLRARENPEPIDLSKKDAYDAEDYFEPVISNDGSVDINPGDACLFGSKEVLSVPDDMSAELDMHSRLGIRGPVHFAGFIDNGFVGSVVYEVTSGELGRMRLEDGMPMSKLCFFRTNEAPDKVYGSGIGSSYQDQVGPRTSNNFRSFDWNHAAKNYSKLDRLVLVQDPDILLRHRSGGEGFELLDPWGVESLVRDISGGFFQSRYDCETDEEVLQLIPYIILFGPEGTVFSYVRAKNMNDYGDDRLFGKHSIGLGGHINESDGPDFLENGLRRELNEEVNISEVYSEPCLVGTMAAREEAVDRVHFGLVYATHTAGSVEVNESALISGRMIRIDEIESDSQLGKKYETWSRILVPSLKEISRLSKS